MLHFGPRDVPNCHEWWSVLNDTDFSGHNSEPLSDYYLKLNNFAAHWVKFCWIAQESFFLISSYPGFFTTHPILKYWKSRSYLSLPSFVRKITTQYTSLTWSPSSYLHLSPFLLPQGLGTSCSPILGRLSPTVVRPPAGCICSRVISSERPFLVQSRLMFPVVNFLQSTSFSHGSPHHLPYVLLSVCL